jgi:molybdopterin converting factor small subunit
VTTNRAPQQAAATGATDTPGGTDPRTVQVAERSGTDPGIVTVRLFAAARAASGGAAALHAPAGPLDRLLAHLRDSQPPRFGEVLAVSSLVSDGVRLDPGHPVELPAGAVIDVLPPFAGG